MTLRLVLLCGCCFSAVAVAQTLMPTAPAESVAPAPRAAIILVDNQPRLGIAPSEMDVVPETAPEEASASEGPIPTAPAKPINPTIAPVVTPAKATAPVPGNAESAPKPVVKAEPVSKPSVKSAPGPTPSAKTEPPPLPVIVEGTIKLTSLGKALRAAETAEAVVYWRALGDKAEAAASTPSKTHVMTTQRKTFMPNVLAITAGDSVRFPNNDPILHNAFSTADGNTFDTGLYGQSDGESFTFAKPGLVRVYCNVHHSMVAHILVLDTPVFVRPDSQGRFRLSVPPGDGELFVWHERAPLWRRALSVNSTTTVNVDIDLSKRKIPTHLNKFGKSYRRQASGY